MHASLRTIGLRTVSLALLASGALAAALCFSSAARAQDDEGQPPTADAPTAPGTPGAPPLLPGQRPNRKGLGAHPMPHQPSFPHPGNPNTKGPATPPAPVVPPPPVAKRASIAPDATANGARVIKAQKQPPADKVVKATKGKEGPPEFESGDKKEAGKNAKLWSLTYDKRELAEVIQYVADITQRNFILPERVSGKITILTNTPVPADEVWNVFLAALDANNWAVYPVGHYWKLSEKKQSSHANIPTLLTPGEEPTANEQMVTKLIKLHYVEAEQMKNTISQFTTRDSDIVIFPPDTLIISDLGLNMLRLERLLSTLDQPGGSE